MLEGCVPWPDDIAESYHRAGYWEGRPLGELLHESCVAHSDRVALVCGDVRMTYAELDAAAAKLAGVLQEKKIRPLDRVVVQLPNVPEFAVTLPALLRIGAVPVMALPGHRRSEIVHLSEHSGAVAYVVMDRFGGFDYRRLAREVRAAVPGVRDVIVSGDHEEFTSMAATGLEPVFPQVDPAEPALFLLSGGTTGTPKLIPRTHNDYLCGIRATTKALLDVPAPVYLVVNPVAHTAALGCPGLLGTLLVGGKVVLTSSRRPSEIFALIRAEDVTLTTLVPPLVRMWMDAARREPVALPGLMLQVGSAKFGLTQAREARRLLGCELTNWFGVGEGMMTYCHVDDGSVCGEGHPLLDADEIVVLDEHGNPVPDGEEGELVVRGPYTIRGYYCAPELNAHAFTTHGHFRTGDLARRSADGSLVIVGRLKDIINRGGNKVPAEEVEEHLRTHPAVRDVGVAGVVDDVLGERSQAYLVVSDGVLKPADLKEYLRGRGLATYKIPDKVIFVSELPCTPVGKLDRIALRASEVRFAD